VSERVVGHIEAMCPDEILTRSAQFEKIDTIARRTFGLNDASSGQGCLSLNILTNHSVVQVKASLSTVPPPANSKNSTVVFYGRRFLLLQKAQISVRRC
jgi:hypothetical protein